MFTLQHIYCLIKDQLQGNTSEARRAKCLEVQSLLSIVCDSAQPVNLCSEQFAESLSPSFHLCEVLTLVTKMSLEDPRVKRAERLKKLEEVERIISQYIHDDAAYEKVQSILEEELIKGLGKSSNASANVKMFPTYVRSLPDGSERGNFLALDLGGTNFRVLLIALDGDKVNMKNKIYPISQDLMLGKGEQLFDHIADCIANFMQAHDLGATRLPLGFTFSFPCKQEGLNRGRLVQWTKGFQCEGVVNEDVVRLLQEAIERRGDITVDCVAILNDTVGCLMSCAFLDHDTEIGVILGTGTNACYMEKLDRVEQWDADHNDPKQVIINTEWGAFGDNGCIDFVRTDVDKDIDAKSLNSGKQIYEKMISGMYMGEIARRVIVKCVSQGLLFNGVSSTDLDTESRFYTKYVSEVEKDEENDSSFTNTKQVLDDLGIDDFTTDDCRNVHAICQAVSRRAAFLASAGIACLLNRIDKPDLTVAVDGSLYRFHPHFHNLMMGKVQQLLKPGIKFKLMLSEDGSGKGAALVAAVAHRLKNN